MEISVTGAGYLRRRFDTRLGIHKKKPKNLFPHITYCENLYDAATGVAAILHEIPVPVSPLQVSIAATPVGAKRLGSAAVGSKGQRFTCFG